MIRLFIPLCITLGMRSGETKVAANKGMSDTNLTKVLGKTYSSFAAGNFSQSLSLAKTLSTNTVHNQDYVKYVLAQSYYFERQYSKALENFTSLTKVSDSRFVPTAKWRQADCLWQLARRDEAAQVYKNLIKDRVPDGEVAVARFRIAQSSEKSRQADAIAGYKEFLNLHPAHRLSADADNRLVALGDKGIAGLTAVEHISRAISLIKSKKWEVALQELAQLDTSTMSDEIRLEHKYWLSMSMFKRRRHYQRAGETFLEIYKKMGSRSADALFHGARALSRSHFDKEAIRWYQVLVRDFPKSKQAPEAQYLSGWLEFNLENYAESLLYFEVMKKRFPNSKIAHDLPWFMGMSHYQLGEYTKAIPFFEKVARRRGAEEGGKGQYWKARTLQRLDETTRSNAIYRQLVQTYPFSWYAHLSRSRLKTQGIKIAPFGGSPRKQSLVPDIDSSIDSSIRKDPLLRKADELIKAGLNTFASNELRRGEKKYFKRHTGQKPSAIAVLLDGYRRAGNFNRPWMLASVHGGTRALNAMPTGKAQIWWKHAYPLAYKKVVERYRKSSGIPDYFLYTIMRKESGFDPHTHSYADARGLLQMIPPTTERVAKRLGLTYTDDLLFDPDNNIKVGAWYIGRLLQKFQGQIAVGAGSYNAGPRAMMRWLTTKGSYPMDEWVELLSFQQTRNYIKRTFGTYSRYKYLYDRTLVELPLMVNTSFVQNEINY